MFFEGDRHCTAAASEIVGTASVDKSRAAVALSGQEERSPATPGRDLQLVHRRVRHERLARSQSAPDRAFLSGVRSLFSPNSVGAFVPMAGQIDRENFPPLSRVR